MSRLSLLAVLGCPVALALLDATQARTFSDAGKAITLQGSGKGEQVLWERTCNASALCIVHHTWYGGAWAGYDTTRIRFYVDGETSPSIDGQLFLSHGIGFADDAAPWSAGALFGKTGSPSGLFNTFQIPFNRTIRCAALSTSAADQRFWWIHRGLELDDPGAAVELGRVKLPQEARLRLFALEGAVVPPLAFVPLLETDPATTRGGALLLTTLSVDRPNSTDGSFSYLEGCMRTYQQAQAPAEVHHRRRNRGQAGAAAAATLAPPAGERTLLSSGTEDYFLGTYYFNRGMFHSQLAGLTHKTDSHSQFSAYRAHVDEPLIFGPPRSGTNTDADADAATKFSLVWRNGDPGGCVDSETAGAPAPSRVFAYVYAYLW